MKLSRRRLMAGVAVAGAGLMVPVAYKEAYQVKRWWAEGGTPNEASQELADVPMQRLANLLRGVWALEVASPTGATGGGSLQGMTLLLDVGERGRGLRGYIDHYDNLIDAGAVPRYQVLGDLVGATGGQVRWRLLDLASARGASAYEFVAELADPWGQFGVDREDTLTGVLRRLDLADSAEPLEQPFIARKRDFVEARDRVPLSAELAAWVVAPQHRVAHQLWHTVRDKWHLLGEDRRVALRTLGWQPGPKQSERDSRGKNKEHNGSGIDFLYMHRHMLGIARAKQAPGPWQHFPLPVPMAETDRVGFIRYFENHHGQSAPPTWLAPQDNAYSIGVAQIKSRDTFYGNFQVWESRFRDPHYLASKTLGQFGSDLEMTLHDWLHICWAAVPRDPASGTPLPWSRDPADFAEHWFAQANDFLGDPFSSHVNPVFWGFHGWIDERIDDWYDAHQRAHPGEVLRADNNGVAWFAKGRWVEIDDPWLGPVTHDCSTGPGIWIDTSVEKDLDVMKLALSIAVLERSRLGSDLSQAHRPWYARNLPGLGQEA
ncbi:PvdJ/PvdD/PvdP-like protein [Pseudomonas typographi]|uniref:pyoverdine maturation tyrosinase PvdP n=1 Tax=Pseudomonas typographi TaxID=2715964 RepID=UPI0016858CA6|nr:PvdJ/PvdD/PvdP-like protein [Pseudomonas typographi]MBD1587033.1 PvdJ/PvdD/PvdP-like protein [Pseudomonas typographi]